MRPLYRQILSLSLASLPLLAWPHARIADNSGLQLRNTNDGNKVVAQPCGANTNLAVTVLNKGSNLTIKWIETIDHNGYYSIDFSPANDANWVVLKTMIPDVQGAVNRTVGRPYETTITLPNQTCDNCTIRLRQFMVDTNSDYFSCANIKLIDPNAVTPPPVTPPPVVEPPAPDPTPTPVEECPAP